MSLHRNTQMILDTVAKPYMDESDKRALANDISTRLDSGDSDEKVAAWAARMVKTFKPT